MELVELKFLAAASLLGGSVHRSGLLDSTIRSPSQIEIEVAVKKAQRIWDEVLRQDQEE